MLCSSSMRWLPTILLGAALLCGCWRMAEDLSGAFDGGTDDTDPGGGPTDPPDTSTGISGEWFLEPMASPTEKDLTAVWGSAADDVYAVGEDGTILHYDGAEWSLVDHGVPQVGNLHAVAGAGADRIWAAGADRKMLHYDGTEWWSQSTPFSPEEEPGAYRGLCVIDQSEAYAVGEGSTIIALDDWGWSSSLEGDGDIDYHAAWCGIGNDVYIAGHSHTAFLSSVLVRYSPLWDTEQLAHEQIDNMYGITADENGQIRAVGFQDSVGSKIYRLSGDDWSVEHTSEHELLGLWASSVHGLWAVGNTADDDSVAVIESWLEAPLYGAEYDGTWRLRAIWGTDAPEGWDGPWIFAVGKEGAIVLITFQWD